MMIGLLLIYAIWGSAYFLWYFRAFKWCDFTIDMFECNRYQNNVIGTVKYLWNNKL